MEIKSLCKAFFLYTIVWLGYIAIYKARINTVHINWSLETMFLQEVSLLDAFCLIDVHPHVVRIQVLIVML